MCLPVCAFLVGFALTLPAAITEGGGGILYGKHPGYMLSVPKGWMFDNESGMKQGLFAVFYPKGFTWQNSKVVGYTRVYALTDKVRDIAGIVADTVAEFHKKGSPDYKAEKKNSIKMENGLTADVYYYTGDKWGNFEAVAYIRAEGWIPYVVLNAKSEDEFKKSLDAFAEIVKSYRQFDVEVEKPGDKEKETTPKKKEKETEKEESKEPKKEKPNDKLL